MTRFIKSPLYETWIDNQQLTKKLTICAPYMKLNALATIFDRFQITPDGDYHITVISNGRPDIFLKGSSDVSALQLLSTIPNVKLCLLDNLHMKAYLFDDAFLLITSGNCTAPGLFSPGNIEAGIGTDEPEMVKQFIEYCDSIIQDALILDTSSKILDYYEKIAAFRLSLSEELTLESRINREIITGAKGFEPYNHHIKGAKRPVYKPRDDNFTAGSSLSDLRKVSIVDTEIDLRELSPEVAYILGGIFIDGASIHELNGKFYNACTVKQNNRPGDKQFIVNLNNHSKYIQEIASVADCNISLKPADSYGLKELFNVHVGFSFLFVTSELNSNKRMRDIIGAVKQSDVNIVRAFLAGIFDTRGYVDSNFGYIGVDVSEAWVVQEIEGFLKKCNVEEYNYNPIRERDNKQGAPRKPQLRIKIKYYCEKIGLISPEKISSSLGYKELTKEQFNSDSLLPGLKRI